jgi:cytochrome c
MMKKTIFLVAMIAAIWSCNSNDSASNDATGNNGAGTGTGPGAASSPENRPATTGNSGTDQNATTATTGGVDVTKNPDYQKGMDLIGKSDCLGCHKVNEKLVGPAYQEVAAKYAGQKGADEMLAGKIIKGGAGNWGQIPMSPHPQLSKEDALAMARYVLLTNQ